MSFPSSFPLLSRRRYGGCDRFLILFIQSRWIRCLAAFYDADRVERSHSSAIDWWWVRFSLSKSNYVAESEPLQITSRFCLDQSWRSKRWILSSIAGWWSHVYKFTVEPSTAGITVKTNKEMIFFILLKSKSDITSLRWYPCDRSTRIVPVSLGSIHGAFESSMIERWFFLFVFVVKAISYFHHFSIKHQ